VGRVLEKSEHTLEGVRLQEIRVAARQKMEESKGRHARKERKSQGMWPADKGHLLGKDPGVKHQDAK